MIPIHRDPKITQKLPLDDKVVPDNFYSGAGRGELLLGLKAAVESGAPLMVLTGGEGSGKTMMCRMLVNQCSSSVFTVLFSDTVESFEDVVKKIAQKLGLGLREGEGGNAVDSAIELIIAHQIRHPMALLVIFDEAENIYLATLERIRKLLDRITAAGARMQILFSGRKSFLENCEQLALCDFHNTDNLRFDILPLTEQDTSEYLQSCYQRLDDSDNLQFFNDEVVGSIYALAKGDFRKTLDLANESLRSHNDDAFNTVLIDNLKDETWLAGSDDQLKKPRLRRVIPLTLWLGGAVCIVFILFVFLRPGEELSISKKVSLSLPSQEQSLERDVHREKKQPEAVAPAEMEDLEKPLAQDFVEPQKKTDNVEQKVAGGVAKNQLTESLEDAGSLAKLAGISEQQDTFIKKDMNRAGASATVDQSKVVRVVTPKIPVLRQNPPLKIKSGTVRASSAVTKGQSPAEAEGRTGVSKHMTVDQIYQKRIGAAGAWKEGEKNGKYTVQLMVLTAKNSEQNFKKMLAQPDYRQEAGNFFIFSKKGRSEVVLVFYGEYSSLDLARQAQNNLPSFLREHQPYAISIKNAVAKVAK